jgi:threonine/homoserine/homoserine lactone efflux protein
VSTLLSFAAVSLLASIVPGPDTAVVTKNGLRHGRRAAVLTAAGCSTGQLGWGLASIAGVGALLATSVVAFTVVKLIGAAYLVALGCLAIIANRRPHGGKDEQPDRLPQERGSRRTTACYRDGLLTNALNPKTALFMSALLPQFIKPGDAHWLPFALVLTTVAVSFSWMGCYASLLDRASRALARPAIRRASERVTGAILIGLGVRVALERQ